LGALVTAKLRSADRKALEASIEKFRAAFAVAKSSSVQGDGTAFWVFLDYVEDGN
jgi:hypothetical protein